MRGLGKAEQEEFATNFADNLANAASGAGEYQVARHVYETLLERYGESPTVRQKVRDDLNRLDKVGKPAPSIAVTMALNITRNTVKSRSVNCPASFGALPSPARSSAAPNAMPMTAAASRPSSVNGAITRASARTTS